MNRTEVLNFLNSENTFNKVLDTINQESLKRGSDIDDYPVHYFLAGGSIANTIYHLFNEGKFDSPVINDIDLFYFNRTENFYWNNPIGDNFIQTDINQDIIRVDGYGRVWIGPNGERMKMANSERFGSINKVTINVVTQTNNFNEDAYYQDLLKVFDLNCCMAGLDRINRKIIYTNDFINFLLTDKIEVTNTSQPLQTTIRLHKKITELITDDSNLDLEMGLIQHSFIFGGVKSIGPEWFEKTKLNRDLVLRYFDFNVAQNQRENNIFSYTVRDFNLNNYFASFYKNFRFKCTPSFWDIFVRRKNDKVFNSLINFYKKTCGENIFNTNKITYEDIKTRKLGINLTSPINFMDILDKFPSYFECEYIDEDLFTVWDKTKIFINDHYVETTILLVNNIKDHLKFLEFIEKTFFDKNNFFKQEVFNKTLKKIYATQSNVNYFEYDKKVKGFKSALNNLWIKDYYGFKNLNHKFIVKKSVYNPYVEAVNLNDEFDW